MASASTPLIVSAAERQPCRSMIQARRGRKRSWPVAVLAVSSPMASPRRATNHRFTTVAPSTSAAIPLPMPTITPHTSTSCHGRVT